MTRARLSRKSHTASNRMRDTMLFKAFSKSIRRYKNGTGCKVRSVTIVGDHIELELEKHGDATMVAVMVMSAEEMAKLCKVGASVAREVKRKR